MMVYQHGRCWVAPALAACLALALPGCPTKEDKPPSGANVPSHGPTGPGTSEQQTAGQRTASPSTAHRPPDRPIAPPSRLRNFRSVWVESPDNGWIGGDEGTLLRWDGSVWCRVEATFHDELVHPWLPQLYGLWGAASNDVWAVGIGFVKGRGSVGAIVHWDGKRWTPSGDLVDGGLRDVWGSGTKDVWAVGHAGTLLHWDGNSWSRVDSTTKHHLMAIGGTDGRDVWAVGQNGTALHWDGRAWTSASVGTTSTLQAVWVGSATDVWAVAAYSEPLRRYDGNAWAPISRPGNESLARIWGASPKDVWVVGIGTVLQWDGSALKAVDHGAAGPLEDIAGTSASDVWVVGPHAILHWDGRSWQNKSDLVRGGRGALPCPAPKSPP